LFTDSLPRHTVRHTVGNPQKRDLGTDTTPNFAQLEAALPAAFLTNARETCKRVIGTTTACAELLDFEPIVESCYRDAILTNSLNFTSDHLMNLHQLCLGKTVSLEELGAEESTFKALVIQQQAGLGEFPCPSSCNRRGKCTEFGCDCNDGFAGNACQIAL
jgi:hypothetical protein